MPDWIFASVHIGLSSVGTFVVRLNVKLRNAWLTQGGPAICASMHLCWCPGGPLGGVTPAGLGLLPWETLPMGGNIGRAGGRKPRNSGLRTDTQNRRGLTPPEVGREEPDPEGEAQRVCYLAG